MSVCLCMYGRVCMSCVCVACVLMRVCVWVHTCVCVCDCFVCAAVYVSAFVCVCACGVLCVLARVYMGVYLYL